ncbi:hypothetical protein NXS08_02955 [Gleimia sp. 6138-11-ORH1]|uniref:hypothetical protein n=1 Tax=Gleimia sp. 6138-11-ORH1 TaxID=2973937 RepID=UPI00216A285C|nr:hypothetical protein [Gleimia sp. 6138-11-ORH1]MCS4484447.1 hypothetical protein [Gleimia sp. 6138-11-ORH1]
MKKQRNMLIIAASLAVVLAGCGKAQGPTAPTLPAPQKVDSIGVIYRIEKIFVEDNQVCAFDHDGKLLVFSEEVSVNETHDTLIFKESQVPIGVEAIGADYKELPDEFKCGSKTYPAKHIQGEGLIPTVEE